MELNVSRVNTLFVPRGQRRAKANGLIRYVQHRPCVRFVTLGGGHAALCPRDSSARKRSSLENPVSKRLHIVFAACVVLVPGMLHAQSYPSKPIRLVVPYAGGSSPDIGSRRLANELGKQMGQQVVVDNRPGASAIIGTELVARAAPDGYTFGYVGTNFVTNLSLFKTLPYDSMRDFQPVILTGSNSHLLAVTPSLPIRSVKELIELARAKPDTLSYGSAGNGSSPHLTMELLKSMTGTQILHVAYKGTQQGITEMIGGQVHLIFDGGNSIGTHVRAGRVRGLAVTTAKRSASFPELPTIAESGVPDYVVMTWSGLIAPSRVSNSVVTRLNAESNKALASAAVKEKFGVMGDEPMGGTAEAFSALIKRDAAKWVAVIKQAGIKPQ
jgi:tripartite-type tricarboxylate transporter receptor subunit TctC